MATAPGVFRLSVSTALTVALSLSSKGAEYSFAEGDDTGSDPSVVYVMSPGESGVRHTSAEPSARYSAVTVTLPLRSIFLTDRGCE